MRILGVGDVLDLGSMYLRLIAQGHQVRVFASDPAVSGILAGMLEMTADWRRELAWIRDAGPDGFVVFETAAHGVIQDELRAQGFQVIGGSAEGDRLEADRAFGQNAMRDAGMRVASTLPFDSFASAIHHVRTHPGRYVYKPSGIGFASGRTFIGEMVDGVDMMAYLGLQERRWPDGEPVRIVLMERLEGVEVGIGAYFDGRRFILPACLDWEHKRFFPGDMGELTGEMGTLVTYRNSERLFAETLGRMEGSLRAGGYHGYININTIVDERGVHPLEFTCRFGYPGFSILQPLQISGWDELFRGMMGAAAHPPFSGFATRDGFAVGVVLTVPPFPYSAGYERLSKGLPVIFDAALDEADRGHLHYGEVALDEDGRLVTAGMVGYIMVVTGCGATATAAREDVYARVRKVYLPNGRYRRDIGERFVEHDQARLQSLGWL
jgi:phosphoribosylamine--glycine ligase